MVERQSEARERVVVETEEGQPEGEEALLFGLVRTAPVSFSTCLGVLREYRAAEVPLEVFDVVDLLPPLDPVFVPDWEVK